MTTISAQTVIDEILEYRYNPTKILNRAFVLLDEITNSQIDIVDASNPFVFSLVNTATNTAAFIQDNAAVNRRQYAVAALTIDDLHYHMSDKDYLNAYAYPAATKLKIILDKNELKNRLIPDPDNNCSKITIPRNAVFSVSNYSFSIQYPIEIRQMPHSGLQVLYIADKVSPLYSLTTNMVPWHPMSTEEGDYIFFEIDAYQFDIIQKFNDLQASSGYKTDIAITDQFYYARVYIQKVTNGVKSWQEIKTTHTPYVYDVVNPTAIITVKDKIVTVTIPPVYISSGLTGKLRMDIYQTKGSVDMDLSLYQPSDYKGVWLTYDETDNSKYLAPIKDMRTVQIYSNSHVNGGRNALSFTELRTRVINNTTGPHNIPITNAQIEVDLLDMGYSLIPNVDLITNRAFLATRKIPNPTDSKIVTAASASVVTVKLDMMRANDIYGAIDNGQMVTLTNKVLYKTVNGVTKALSPSEVNAINNQNLINKCNQITTGSYFYSPFTYVLDATKDVFDFRAYYIDNPNIAYRNFVAENATSGLQASIASTYGLTKTNTGYKLTVGIKGSEYFNNLEPEQVYVQISFTSKTQEGVLYMDGEYYNTDEEGERIYTFSLDSNLDIDSNNLLSLAGFTGANSSVAVRAALTQEVSFVIIVDTDLPNTYRPTLDYLMGVQTLPTSAAAITHEKLTLNFGYSLDSLWTRARSIAQEAQYDRHVVDVPAKYAEDVFKVDPNTGAMFEVINKPDGSYTTKYEILHKKGDPVLDASNAQVYTHRVGDLKLVDGKPILKPNAARYITRLIDVCVIEGQYYFVDEPIMVAYKESITKQLLSWILNDISYINNKLLEKTSVYFYPKVSSGEIPVFVNSGALISVTAAQAIDVNLVVRSYVYTNSSLITEINNKTVKIIADYFSNNNTYAVSELEQNLRSVYQTDVIDVKIGFPQLPTYTVLTMKNDTDRFSIRKRLATSSDDRFYVTEDVNISYVVH
jgi:hypothetical protein